MSVKSSTGGNDSSLHARWNDAMAGSRSEVGRLVRKVNAEVRAASWANCFERGERPDDATRARFREVFSLPDGLSLYDFAPSARVLASGVDAARLCALGEADQVRGMRRGARCGYQPVANMERLATTMEQLADALRRADDKKSPLDRESRERIAMGLEDRAIAARALTVPEAKDGAYDPPATWEAPGLLPPVIAEKMGLVNLAEAYLTDESRRVRELDPKLDDGIRAGILDLRADLDKTKQLAAGVLTSRQPLAALLPGATERIRGMSLRELATAVDKRNSRAKRFGPFHMFANYARRHGTDEGKDCIRAMAGELANALDTEGLRLQQGERKALESLRDAFWAWSSSDRASNQTVAANHLLNGDEKFAIGHERLDLDELFSKGRDAWQRALEDKASQMRAQAAAGESVPERSVQRNRRGRERVRELQSLIDTVAGHRRGGTLDTAVGQRAVNALLLGFDGVDLAARSAEWRFDRIGERSADNHQEFDAAQFDVRVMRHIEYLKLDWSPSISRRS